MPECPGCFGEGEHDITDLLPEPVALLARLAELQVTAPCSACDGSGEVSESELRDMEAWATARVDQFLAAEAAGEFGEMKR